MAKANRQKYNFLAAWLTQLETAMDEGDELYGNVSEFLRLITKAEALSERIERCEADLDSVNRGLAAVELALEELDDGGGSSLGEVLDEDDDGDDDDELGGLEPEVGGVRQPDRRPPAAVDRAGDRQVSRRPVKVPVSRGT